MAMSKVMARAAIVVLGIILVGSVAPAVSAQTRGEVRGEFVRLVEKRVGDREFLGVVVARFGGKGQATLLVPMRRTDGGHVVRNEDLAAWARALRPGTKVEVAYVVDDGQMFIKRAESAQQGEKRRDNVEAVMRKLEARLKEMEKVIARLREENNRLKRRLEEKGAPAKPASQQSALDEKVTGREAAGGLPDGMRGFRGMLRGTIVRKGDGEFLLKVEKVLKVWEQNRAENPQSAVGKTLAVVLPQEGRLLEQQRRAFRELKAGDRVVVEPFHFRGNALTVVEELRKAD
jgi:hypothetical protein